MNLGNLLTASALRNPHNAALIFQEESVSYEQLDAATTFLAQALLAQGCQPGDRIALHWPNSIEMAKLLFACFKAGLIAVPINLFLKASEIAHILANSGAAMCFTPPGRISVVREAAQGCARLREIHTSVDAMCGTNSEVVLPGVKSDDAALILYTSETTARPKGVTHTHRTLVESIKLGRKTLRDSLETALLMTQMTYISGICGCLLPAVASGGTTVVAPAFAAPLVLDLIERFHCDYAFALPSMVQFMIEEQATRPRNVRSLRTFLAAGDSVPVKNQQRFRSLFGISLQEAYGMTESAPIMANPAAKICPGSLGKVLDGVKARVVDGDGRDVPDGECGEIIVQSPASFVGYWENPAATRETLQDGWVYTGDLAHHDPDGYFWFDGRKKEIIVRGSYNISPQEVEEAIHSYPAVLEVAVVGVPDAIYGESVIAFVVLREGHVSGEQELKDHTSKRLADIKVPEKILFQQTLPKGITGKVQRRALMEVALEAVA